MNDSEAVVIREEFRKQIRTEMKAPGQSSARIQFWESMYGRVEQCYKETVFSESMSRIFVESYKFAMQKVNEVVERAWYGEEGWDDDLNDEKETSA